MAENIYNDEDPDAAGGAGGSGGASADLLDN
jgi:hypothetical protein